MTTTASKSSSIRDFMCNRPGLLASRVSREEILVEYPYLEDADIDAALEFAAWRVEEREDVLVGVTT